MKLSIRNLAILALVLLVLGAVPSVISFVASIVSIILIMLLYSKLDKLNVHTNLYKLSVKLYGVVLCLILPLLIFRAFGLEHSDLGRVIEILFLEGLLIVLAFLNYKIANNMFVLANKSQNMMMKIAAWITRVGAWTTPMVIGLIVIGFAQIFFLIACINIEEQLEAN